MTRWFDTRLGGGLGLLALASAMGCESQVNDEYTGEPLLSLQGNVVVHGADQLDADLVPGIAFPKPGDSKVAIVNGDIDGEFPAKFRFDVTQPPPDAALYEPSPEIGIHSKYRFGLLVLAPSQLESPVFESVEFPYLDEQCTDDGTQCTRIERECTDDSGERCREREVECTQHACDLVEQWGDADMQYSVSGVFAEYCDFETCSVVESGCDEENRCRTEVYRCDFAQYGAWEHSEAGVMTTCNVQHESGDTSFVTLDELQIGVNYWVAYVTEDSPNSVWGPLKRGYNLLGLAKSHADWVDAQECWSAAVAKAVAEYNQEHGTNHDSLGLQLGSSIWIAADQECGVIRVVDEPLDEVLTIEMGRGAPQPF